MCVKNLVSIFTEDIIYKNTNQWDAGVYLKRDDNGFRSTSLTRNQNFLLKNNILYNLMDLFDFIIEICYGSLMHLKTEFGTPSSMMKLPLYLKKIEDFFQLKLPQVFFKDYLDNIIESILNLFYLVSYNNPKTSRFFLTRFKSFYPLLYLFKRKIKNFITEITSNSQNLGNEYENLLEVIFDDLEPPVFELRYLDKRHIKLKFIKNLLKNLLKKRTNDNQNAISQIGFQFSATYDHVFYIQFDKDSDFETGEIIYCKFFIVKNENILYNERKQTIVRKMKANLQEDFKNNIIEIDKSGENFDMIKISLSNVGKKSNFFMFLKYYVKIKSLIFKAHYSFGILIAGLKQLEEDNNKLVLPYMTINPHLDLGLKKGVSNFVVQVSLHMDKYNYFTDDHDFTYFCQKM